MSNIIVPKALAYQTTDSDIERELDSVKAYIDCIKFDSEQNISVVLLKGHYSDLEKKMNTVIAFVNRLPKAIKELHCVLTVSSELQGIQFSKSTLNFTEDFMGEVMPEDILLVHINIPVKGLSCDRVFSNKELKYTVNDVRVTYVEG